MNFIKRKNLRPGVFSVYSYNPGHPTNGWELCNIEPPFSLTFQSLYLKEISDENE
jgi:hypothetical protein